ncbi:retrovirus-related pol polyprotein from transposon TNT 1-94 [Tanacetum coccineum]
MSPSSSLPSFYELSLDVQSCKLFCKFLYGLTPFVLSNALNGVGGMLQGMGFSLFLPLTMLCSFSHCKRSRRTDWLRVQQMMKGSDIRIHDKKAKLFNEWEMFTSTDEELIESYYHPARAEGNGNGNENNGNQVRCYNYRGIGHLARNCIVKPRRMDVAYLQTQLLIAQKEEARIQLRAEKFDLMAVAGDLDKIEEVNANCILMANLQQASTSGNQTDNAPVYDSDGSTKVHHSKNCYDNDIFDMFTQVEQYNELLEPISKPHQVQQNDCNVISIVSSMEQCRGTVEQNPAIVEETHAYFESLYNNLAIEVEKVNSVNRKIKETNAELTTELAR